MKLNYVIKSMWKTLWQIKLCYDNKFIRKQWISSNVVLDCVSWHLLCELIYGHKVLGDDFNFSHALSILKYV